MNKTNAEANEYKEDPRFAAAIVALIVIAIWLTRPFL
jgi:hypothetical protein